MAIVNFSATFWRTARQLKQLKTNLRANLKRLSQCRIISRLKFLYQLYPGHFHISRSHYLQDPLKHSFRLNHLKQSAKLSRANAHKHPLFPSAISPCNTLLNDIVCCNTIDSFMHLIQCVEFAPWIFDNVCIFMYSCTHSCMGRDGPAVYSNKKQTNFCNCSLVPKIQFQFHANASCRPRLHTGMSYLLFQSLHVVLVMKCRSSKVACNIYPPATETNCAVSSA